MDNDTAASLHAYLVSRRADQFNFLSKLVRMVTENPPGECTAAAERITELLTGLGFDAQLHFVDADACESLGRAPLANIIARKEFGQGPCVALSAGGDTMPAGDGWSRPPFDAVIMDGRMYGRGVVDKADVATYAFAILALAEACDAHTGSAELHVTFDTQRGGALGTQWLLDQQLTKPDFVIASGLSHEIVTTVAGQLVLEVQVQGRRAPAALPGAGTDAIAAAAHAMAALNAANEAHESGDSGIDGLGAPSLVVTSFEGGGAADVIADRARLRVDRRLLPHEDPKRVEAELTKTIGGAMVKVPGAICKVKRLTRLPAVTAGPESNPLIEILTKHAEAVKGEAPPQRGTAHDPLGRFYGAEGIPTVLFGAGPGSRKQGNMDGSDEVLDLDELRRTTEILVLAMAELLER